MGHRSRRQKQLFKCGHRGFGQFCHFCKDKEAGKPVGIKKKRRASGGASGADSEPVPMRKWKRARCPFCNGTRVKKNPINAMSSFDIKEFSCKERNCGKEFNEEQVTQWDEVEVPAR